MMLSLTEPYGGHISFFTVDGDKSGRTLAVMVTFDTAVVCLTLEEFFF